MIQNGNPPDATDKVRMGKKTPGESNQNDQTLALEKHY